jgi:hypothetical protein
MSDLLLNTSENQIWEGGKVKKSETSFLRALVALTFCGQFYRIIDLSGVVVWKEFHVKQGSNKTCHKKKYIKGATTDREKKSLGVH